MSTVVVIAQTISTTVANFSNILSCYEGLRYGLYYVDPLRVSLPENVWTHRISTMIFDERGLGVPFISSTVTSEVKHP